MRVGVCVFACVSVIALHMKHVCGALVVARLCVRVSVRTLLACLVSVLVVCMCVFLDGCWHICAVPNSLSVCVCESVLPLSCSLLQCVRV